MTDASIDGRVEDLVARMNLDEKLAQVGSIYLTELVRGDRFDYRQRDVVATVVRTS